MRIAVIAGRLCITDWLEPLLVLTNLFASVTLYESKEERRKKKKKKEKKKERKKKKKKEERRKKEEGRKKKEERRKERRKNFMSLVQILGRWFTCWILY